NVTSLPRALRAGGRSDPTPVRIVTNGDLVGANLPYIPKPIRLIVGGEIDDLLLNIEHLSDASASLISAGGGIRYRTPRDGLTGSILTNTLGVQVEGPGLLAVEAGRGVDLGTSTGLSAVGNLTNPSLPDGGAQVSVLAGARARD